MVDCVRVSMRVGMRCWCGMARISVAGMVRPRNVEAHAVWWGGVGNELGLILLVG